MKCPLTLALFCTVLTPLIGCQSETTSTSSGPFRVDGNTGRATGQALGINFEVFGATDIELKASKPAETYARTKIVLAGDAIIQLEMLERGNSVSLQLNGTDFGTLKEGDSVVIDEQRDVNGTQFVIWFPPDAIPKIDLSLEMGALEVLIVDQETGALRLQRDPIQCGGTVVLPDPDGKRGSLYWLRPVKTPDEETHSEGNEHDR